MGKHALFPALSIAVLFRSLDTAPRMARLNATFAAGTGQVISIFAMYVISVEHGFRFRREMALAAHVPRPAFRGMAGNLEEIRRGGRRAC